MMIPVFPANCSPPWRFGVSAILPSAQSIFPSDGLILDVSGCAHLWGGERPYLKEIITRLRAAGYQVRGAMADTIGAAWAVARFGQITPLIGPGEQVTALLPLPPAALRLEPATLDRLQKLGLYQIRDFNAMPRSALRRRFGKDMLLRMDQAFGQEAEAIIAVQPAEPYQERLPCLEPIRTATGIEIALTRLLEILCVRLQKEGEGPAYRHLFRLSRGWKIGADRHRHEQTLE